MRNSLEILNEIRRLKKECDDNANFQVIAGDFERTRIWRENSLQFQQLEQFTISDGETWPSKQAQNIVSIFREEHLAFESATMDERRRAWKIIDDELSK